MKFRKILRVIKNKIKINCLMSKMRVNKNRKKREILLWKIYLAYKSKSRLIPLRKKQVLINRIKARKYNCLYILIKIKNKINY